MAGTVAMDQAESDSSLLPILWLISPACWLCEEQISSEFCVWLTSMGLLCLYFLTPYDYFKVWLGWQRGRIRKLQGNARCRGYSDGAPRGVGASGKHVVLPVPSLIKFPCTVLQCWPTFYTATVSCTLIPAPVHCHHGHAAATACWRCNPITGLNCSSWQALALAVAWDMLSTSA